LLIPVSLRTKALVCARAIYGIAGSNTFYGLGCSSLVFVVCRVGSGLCVELITRLEESYRMCVCVWSRSINSDAVWARVGLLGHGDKRMR